jgi:two-component system phosphate regulon response regulator PhoB
LDKFRFHVAEAADGEEALSLITATEPHVILTDWSLPTMPVSRLMRWLAQGWRTRHIPVIVMADDLDPAADWSRANPAGVLIKPFPLAMMLHEIRRVLRASLQISGGGSA